MSDVVGLVGLLILAVGVVWFYPHCVRPALAHSQAAPWIFDVHIIATVVTASAAVLLALDWLTTFIPSAAYEVVRYALVLYVAPATRFLVPGVWARLGPRDPTAEFRLMLTWFGREWRRHPEEAGRVRVAAGLFLELSRGTLLETEGLEAWRRALDDYRRALIGEGLEPAAAEGMIDGMFARVVPVDRIARFF